MKKTEKVKSRDLLRPLILPPRFRTSSRSGTRTWLEERKVKNKFKKENILKTIYFEAFFFFLGKRDFTLACKKIIAKALKEKAIKAKDIVIISLSCVSDMSILKIC